MGFVFDSPADGLTINRVSFARSERSGSFVFLDEDWIDFHETIVGVLKEKFQIEGIMGCRFKPYSYVLGVGEGIEGNNELIKAQHIIFECEL